MTRSELLELVSHGESSGVEFKRDDIRPEQLAKEIVAFANFMGGRLLLGVDDDGSIAGIHREDLGRWIMDTVVARYVHPVIIPFYEEIRIGDRTVAVVSVAQGTTKPYVVRDKDREDVYIRMGNTSRLATREQQARVYAIGGLLHPESLPVSGSGLADLSRDRLLDYVGSVLGEPAIPGNDGEWQELLGRLGFMTDVHPGPSVCTIAGLVLFGRSPRRLLHQAGIRWMAFPGSEKDYRALDDRWIDGPLVSRASGKGVLDDLVEAMRPFLSEEPDSVDSSLRRERAWTYPVEAIREALVNAVAHRDWTRYEEIEVVRYRNRLEVRSPGALQNGMTVEKMIAGQRSPRNPLIVGVLRDYGYVDARGMGVRQKIIPLLREHNGTEPTFEATDDHVTVVMRAKRLDVFDSR